MFGARYSRLKFWIWSILLLIPWSVLTQFVKATENLEFTNGYLTFSILLVIVTVMWINALSNRIRDYGSNPWISLFSLIPLVNIGLALYYGIANKKNIIDSATKNNNTDTSLTKAVYNHSKDFASEIKPTIKQYKENHKTPKSEPTFQDIVNEDSIYEQVMIEIEEDKKIKSTWAKALAYSDGNKDKAESLYIKDRFLDIKKDLIEKNKQKEKEELQKQRQKSETEKLQKEKSNFENNQKKSKENSEKEIKEKEISDPKKIDIMDLIEYSISFDYYTVLSKNVVRKKGTWNDFNLIVTSEEFYIEDSYRNIIKSYNIKNESQKYLAVKNNNKDFTNDKDFSNDKDLSTFEKAKLQYLNDYRKRNKK